MWHVDTAAAEALAFVAEILGAGGGDNPYLGKLHLQRLLRGGAAPLAGNASSPGRSAMWSDG